MFCPNCGNQVPDGAQFCASCGAVMGSVAESTAPQTGQAPVANPDPQQYADQAPYGTPSPYQPPAQNQGYAQNQQPMQPQGFTPPASGAYPGQAAPTASGGGNMVGIAMKAGLVATVVWVFAMLLIPFQDVSGLQINNVTVASNTILMVIVTIALGGATIFDFISRSGSDVLFSGIIMTIWTVKSMVETVNAGWDFAIGAYLAIACAIIITIAGFLCRQKSSAGVA